MTSAKTVTTLILLLTWTCGIAQPLKLQQGMVLKTGTGMRLGNIHVLNKNSRARSLSSSTGVFEIAALPGDTILFTADNYTEANLLVSDLADKIVFMAPATTLDEVLIKANSVKSDLRETQFGYRRKSVFYTGTPHYYYFFLKPMTFIYENFKSEVIQARRFNRFARLEITAGKIAERFNNTAIKSVVPIKDTDLEYFKDAYLPTIQQLNVWNDFDLANYIRSSYADYEIHSATIKNTMALN